MVLITSPLEQYDIYSVFSLNMNMHLNNVLLYFLIAASLSPLILYLGTQGARLGRPAGGTGSSSNNAGGLPSYGQLVANWWGI